MNLSKRDITVLILHGLLCYHGLAKPAAVLGYGYHEGLAQDCSNSSSLAMELLQSYAKLSITST